MKMYPPGKNQGQMVEISYGWGDGGSLYMRIFDRSDRSVRWFVADDEEVASLSEDELSLWDDEPAIRDWAACEEPVE